MNKITQLLCILVLISTAISAQTKYNKDSLYRVLDKTMQDKEYYIIQKEQKIDFYKQMLGGSDADWAQQYNINKQLYSEYEKFQSDSALLFLKKNKEIALRLNDKVMLNETDIRIASMYSTIGLFVESKEILNRIEVKNLPAVLRSNYYETYISYYDHYGQNNNNRTYYKMSAVYRDSLVAALVDTTSMGNKILYAEDLYYNQEVERAEQLLKGMLDATTEQDKERAPIAYLLGAISESRGDKEMQEQYFILAAITDIANAIKNHASLQGLALVNYQNGNIDRAYTFMKFAIDDALFCNVRYRASEGLSSYPLINASYEAKEAKQKEELRLYLVCISILLLFLMVALFYVYKQMKRVSKIRKQLHQSSVKLIDLNQEMKDTNLQLEKMNLQLSEVNLVKEEYIAQFFDLCSAYIDKMEDYRLSLNKLAINKQLAELFQKLKSTNFVDEESGELYQKFDSIFVTLYPSFVADFNALLKDEEQIVLKPNELLTTELRIFALIRLGITDSAKIAKFLRYSISTIYNYRTSARNKAIVLRNEFEKQVMEIGIIHNK